MTREDSHEWRTLERRELLDARPWLRVSAEDVGLPNGRRVDGFLTLEMPDYAVIVALTADGRVVAQRQYKHGPRRVSWSLPAGYLEPGEIPLEAARRELLEETGFAAADWRPLGSYTADGNRGAGTAHLFLARGATRVADPDADDLEEIAVHLLPFEELAAAARSGEVAVLGIAAAIGLAAMDETTAR